MLVGVFAAATAIAVASTQIDGIGATNVATIPKTALVESETKVSKLDSAPDVKSDPEKGINDDPGVKEALESMRKNTGVERADVVELVDTNPDRIEQIQSLAAEHQVDDYLASILYLSKK